MFIKDKRNPEPQRKGRQISIRYDRPIYKNKRQKEKSNPKGQNSA